MPICFDFSSLTSTQTLNQTLIVSSQTSNSTPTSGLNPDPNPNLNLNLVRDVGCRRSKKLALAQTPQVKLRKFGNKLNPTQFNSTQQTPPTNGIA